VGAGGNKADRGLRYSEPMLKDFINDPTYWRNRADFTAQGVVRLN
jgi:hypothetical protein